MATIDDVIAEIRRLAAEKPDYVYKKPPGSALCANWYWDGDRRVGSCIVGQALGNLVGLDAVPIGNGSSISMLNAGIPVGPRGKTQWVAMVQCEQDQGLPWGEAVAFADNTCPLEG